MPPENSAPPITVNPNSLPPIGANQQNPEQSTVPQVNPTITPPPRKTFPIKKLITGIVLLLILIVIGTSSYYLNLQKQRLAKQEANIKLDKCVNVDNIESLFPKNVEDFVFVNFATVEVGEKGRSATYTNKTAHGDLILGVNKIRRQASLESTNLDKFQLYNFNFELGQGFENGNGGYKKQQTVIMSDQFSNGLTIGLNYEEVAKNFDENTSKEKAKKLLKTWLVEICS